MTELPEYVDNFPNMCGAEDQLTELIASTRSRPVFTDGETALGELNSACSIALHMHQPLIPAGGGELKTAEIIGNLQHMTEHPDIGDNHNAGVFRWCYKRMGEFVPQLVAQGLEPRVMLEYSGTLLHGLRQMGAHDVLDALKLLATDPVLRNKVEWLGCPWGHAVAPSTPIQDFRLHVSAWQHHFAALFGWDALARVRGFSPAEMALPNHPEVAYAFCKTLVDAGYQWVLVQEHSVETPDGRAVSMPHVPHRLVCRNGRGDTATILAIIKTQGSDTKLVGQMQPYYEAKGLGRVTLGGMQSPPLVTQIADGENGGVMMNEFPPKYQEVVRECTRSTTPLMNVSEYLEQLWVSGVRVADLPIVQPIFQSRIWQRLGVGSQPARASAAPAPRIAAARADRFATVPPEDLAAVIDELRRQDDRFHMEGGSWTNNISWVRGYENVLQPMERASAAFAAAVSRNVSANDPRYRKALFHLLTAETSCFRYWGQGVWTDYGAELARRAQDASEALG